MKGRFRAWLGTPAIGALLLSLSLLMPATSARADVIYAAIGDGISAGSLYTLNPTTGLATLVGMLALAFSRRRRS